MDAVPRGGRVKLLKGLGSLFKATRIYLGHVRETCHRFVDLRAGVGPRTPYADVSLSASSFPCVEMQTTWDDS